MAISRSLRGFSFPSYVRVVASIWIQEAIAIFMSLMALALFVALVTYSSNDPSWLQATDQQVQNWMGKSGATFADIMLQTLGFASLLMPAVILLWAVEFFMKKGFTFLFLRLTLFPMTMLFASASLSAVFINVSVPTPAGVGGHLGNALSGLLYQPMAWMGMPHGAAFVSALLYTLLFCGCMMVMLGVLQRDWYQLKRAYSELREGTGEFWEDLKYTMGRFRNPKIDPKVMKPSEEPIFQLSDDPYDDSLPGVKTVLPFIPEENALDAVSNNVDIDLYDDYNDEIEDDIKSSVVTSADRASSSEKTPAYAKKKKAPAKSLELGQRAYRLPSLELLQLPSHHVKDSSLSPEALENNAENLQSVLEDFGVKGLIKETFPGPVVTLYELEPAPGTRSSRVIGLADDIARAMSALSARVAVVSGKNAIGIELPNVRRETVYLRELVASKEYENGDLELPLTLGKDIGGKPIIADLARMPHLLIAGTTGSGKSVGINTMILSLLYRLPPHQCKMIMIDPKMLELSIYDGIPHLLTPVVINPKKAVLALKWVVREMEERYELMSRMSVRKLSAYNKRISEAKKNGEIITRTKHVGFNTQTGEPLEEEEVLSLESLPYIVVVVDEMADLMMVAGKEIEGAIQRLAQMARAAGIHLIMATQRPSVDVITGTIKANFPTRISFQVTSKIDSRTILGEQGAEQLLGQGDMLYMEAGGRIRRVHGAFVSDHEVEEVVMALKRQGNPTYLDDILVDPDEDKSSSDTTTAGEVDALYQQAVDIVVTDGKASTSYIQRKMKIGYNRAARIIDQMEENGIVSPADHTGKREIIGA